MAQDSSDQKGSATPAQEYSALAYLGIGFVAGGLFAGMFVVAWYWYVALLIVIYVVTVPRQEVVNTLFGSALAAIIAICLFVPEVRAFLSWVVRKVTNYQPLQWAVVVVGLAGLGWRCWQQWKRHVITSSAKQKK